MFLCFFKQNRKYINLISKSGSHYFVYFTSLVFLKIVFLFTRIVYKYLNSFKNITNVEE